MYGQPSEIMHNGKSLAEVLELLGEDGGERANLWGANLQGANLWSTDERIAEMDDGPLAWWEKWKPVLRQIIEMSPAEPTQ